MDGMTLAQLGSSIGSLFTVYAFGADTIGQTIAFLVILGFFWMMTVKFGVSSDGQILTIGIVGIVAGAYMFKSLGILTAFVFGIMIFIALAKLIRR